MTSAATVPGEALARAIALLEERFRPVAILLYGSHASGRAAAESDIDLGIVVGRDTIDPFSVASAKTELEAVLGRPVDLAVLDGASPILRMEALRNHRILSRRDPEAYERFVVRTLGDYFDLKKVREPIEKALLSGPPS
ncbi:MAG: type VII toxin-antitoxin system MntA family adenylyltransferase antitoxin [Candidatus Binatia bacterium]